MSEEVLKRMEVLPGLSEMGIRNMKSIGKEYKTAEIYFHIDLDGVTSAIGIKEYLRRYGIRTIAAHPIQYGDMEWAVPKPTNKVLAVMVDFAHGKTSMKIHTDHHEGQIGFSKDASVAFQKAPSNASYISQTIATRDIFPANDLEIIDTVDSANFVPKGITTDDIMRAVFKVDKTINVEKNHWAMGLACNKLLLAYKNKPGFLSDIVMNANPSLLSMFRVIRRLADQAGYNPPEVIEKHLKTYVEKQKEKFKAGESKGMDKGLVKNLKSGDHTVVGSTIVQYGGGYMGKGRNYDRYTPFRIHPDAEYICLSWPMGLVQISKNPFTAKKNPYNLIKITQKVMQKYKAQWSRRKVSLAELKRRSEGSKKMTKESMGFSFNDFIAHYRGRIHGLNRDDKTRWNSMIRDISNKRFRFLSVKQKDQLENVWVTMWDIVQVQSGGHHDIANIQALNYWGQSDKEDWKEAGKESARENEIMYKKVLISCAIEMKDKRLK